LCHDCFIRSPPDCSPQTITAPRLDATLSIPRRAESGNSETERPANEDASVTVEIVAPATTPVGLCVPEAVAVLGCHNEAQVFPVIVTGRVQREAFGLSGVADLGTGAFASVRRPS
jgi:hypothetical protein